MYRHFTLKSAVNLENFDFFAQCKEIETESFYLSAKPSPDSSGAEGVVRHPVVQQIAKQFVRVYRL